jgi:methyl-accepting chemotaxis protein
MTNWIQWRGSDRDIERRVRQIRELVRLSNSLHADVGLAEILTQLANAVSSTIGFGSAVFNLAHEGSDYLEVAAVAGLTPAEFQRLRASPPPLSKLLRVMRPEFCLSRSYYINHQYIHLLDGIETISVQPAPPPGTQRPPDSWHPEDMLLVPLISSRSDQLLGILSLDQPEDGKVPSLETIEVVELFANQAAVAIDMASLFEERERERRSLEASLYTLLYEMGEVGQGNLAVRADLEGSALSPIGDSLNAAVARLGSVLADVRKASEVVSQSAAEVHAAATKLAQAAQHQALYIVEVSSAVAGVATGVNHISSIADSASSVAQEAVAISKQGREAAERAVAGMAGVREMSLQSARKVKRLGESTQEIGEIVQMVSGFANQTNLLALNAAIEAARAGEHGRGFTIVAQEIRNLATSSAEATKAIHARIKAIQNDTSAVVVTIEESTRQVVTQSEMVAQAGAALEAVDAVTERIGECIGEITHTAGQQAQVSSTIAGSMEDISHITTQARDGMEHMRSSMEHLAELAESLLQSISVFRLGPVGPVYGQHVTGQLSPGGESGFQRSAFGPEQPLLLPGVNPADAATAPMPALTPTNPQNGTVSSPSGAFPAAQGSGADRQVGESWPGRGSSEQVVGTSEAPGAAVGPASHPQPYGAPPLDGEIPPPPPGFEAWGK